MNKWVKIGLGVGAGVLVTTQAVKYAKKHDYVNKLMASLKHLDDFSELKNELMNLLETFNRRENPSAYAALDYDKHEESLSDAVKSLLDTKIVQDLIPEQSDIDMIKEVVDEAAKLEHLIRGWLK